MRAYSVVKLVVVAALSLVAVQQVAALPVSGSLVMHFDAANVHLSSSNNVDRWYNQGTAGATLDALQVSTAPKLITGGPNSQPVVRFTTGTSDAVDSFLQTGPLGSDLTQPLTIFNVSLVTNPTPTGSGVTGRFVYDGRITTKRAAFYNAATTTTNIYGGSASPGAAGVVLGSYQSWASVFNGAASHMNLNGTPFVSNVDPGSHVIDGFTIGGRFADSGPNGMNGDVAEIAVYNRLLNAAEFKIMSNFYSAKYQLPVATNLYDGDNNGAGGYDFNVFGIGNSGAITQAAATQFAAGTVTTSNSLRGLAINSTSSLDVNDFVLAGDRNLANSLTTADVPTNTSVRWDRVWNIDQTNTTNFNLVFDFSEAGISIPDGATSYQLLRSSGEALSFTIVSENFTVSGDQVTFAITGASFLDGYYTLGIYIAIPEPSSALLLGLGCCGMSMLRRRKQHAAGKE